MEIQQSAESELSVSSSQPAAGGLRWTGFLKIWSLSHCSIKSIYTSKPLSRQKSWSCSYLCVYIKQHVCSYSFNIWTVGWRFSSSRVIYIFLPHSSNQNQDARELSFWLTAAVSLTLDQAYSNNGPRAACSPETTSEWPSPWSYQTWKNWENLMGNSQPRTQCVVV